MTSNQITAEGVSTWSSEVFRIFSSRGIKWKSCKNRERHRRANHPQTSYAKESVVVFCKSYSSIVSTRFLQHSHFSWANLQPRLQSGPNSRSLFFWEGTRMHLSFSYFVSFRHTSFRLFIILSRMTLRQIQRASVYAGCSFLTRMPRFIAPSRSSAKCLNMSVVSSLGR